MNSLARLPHHVTLPWGRRSCRCHKDHKWFQKRARSQKGELEDGYHLPRSTWLLPKQGRYDRVRSEYAHCAQVQRASSSPCGRADSVRARAFRAVFLHLRRMFLPQLRQSNRSCGERSDPNMPRRDSSGRGVGARRFFALCLDDRPLGAIARALPGSESPYGEASTSAASQMLGLFAHFRDKTALRIRADGAIGAAIAKLNARAGGGDDSRFIKRGKTGNNKRVACFRSVCWFGAACSLLDCADIRS